MKKDIILDDNGERKIITIEFPPQITNLDELKKYNFSADKTYIASGYLELAKKESEEEE